MPTATGKDDTNTMVNDNHDKQDSNGHKMHTATGKDDTNMMALRASQPQHTEKNSVQPMESTRTKIKNKDER